MKLKRQGAGAVHISLTKEDLELYAISAEELDYDSPQGKRVIRDLIDKARRETGFDPCGGKTYIQMLPSSKGGCELYVIRLEAERERDCIFFSDFDSLFAAVSAAAATPAGASLWREKKRGAYYACFPKGSTPAIFSEFGEKIKAPSLIYLNSRCRRVRWEERQIYDGTGTQAGFD